MLLHLPVRRMFHAALTVGAAFLVTLPAAAQAPIKAAAVFGPPVRQPGNPGDLNPTTPSVFEAIGPNNYTSRAGGTFGSSAATGRVNAVAYDPRNTSRAYAATAGGGIWRTVNGGLRWSPIGDTSFPMLSFSAIAVNPKNTQILYAGMGDFNGAYGGSEINLNIGGGGTTGIADNANYPGYGVMRSLDGGDTWSKINTLNVFPHHVSQIIVDPSDPNIITVSAGRGAQGLFYASYFGKPNRRYPFPQSGGVWRSTNGGTSWTKPLSGDFSSLTVGIPDRSGKRVMYAGSVGDGVYISEDNGAAWRRLVTPAGYNSALIDNPSKVMVVASPSNSETVYATNIDFDAVYRSDNRGGTWRNIIGGLAGGFNEFAAGNSGVRQASYTLYLAASTINSSAAGLQDVLYLGYKDIYASTGANGTWTNISRNVIHEDQQYLAVSPSDPNSLLAANNGGIYGLRYDPTRRVYFIDGQHNRTLSVAQLLATDGSSTDSFQVLSGGADIGSAFTFGSILSWQQVLSANGAGVGVNPTDSTIQLASTHNNPILLRPFPLNPLAVVTQNIYQTQNGWITSQLNNPDWATDKKPTNLKMVVDEVYPHPVFVGTDNLWKLSNGAWAKIGSTLATAPAEWLSVTRADGEVSILTNQYNRLGTISAIWIGPQGGVGMIGSNHGDVQISEDLYKASPTWVKIADPSSADNVLPLRDVTAIYQLSFNSALVGINALNKASVWRVNFRRDPTSGAVITDTQKGWTASAAGLPGDNAVNAITRSGGTGWLYAGTDTGLYVSTDNGFNWVDYGTSRGLPKVKVTGVKFFPGTGYALISTYGRGVYRYLSTSTDPF